MCSAGIGGASVDDYKIIKLIGKGGFGKVFLVQHKETKNYHAMKCMRKDEILDYEKV